MKRLVLLLIAVSVLYNPQMLTAQENGGGSGVIAYPAGPVGERTPTPAWGTASEAAISIPGTAFYPRTGVGIWGSTGDGNRYRATSTIGGTAVTTDMWLDAEVNLPSGATVTGLLVDYCDTGVGDVWSWFSVQDSISGNLTQFPSAGLKSVNAPGCTYMYTAIPAGSVVISNGLNSYFARIRMDTVGETNLVRGVIVYYKLQVSPAPGAARFTDVATTHPFFQYIEALAASGVTSGCAASQYCPDAFVTRGQMAVFLSRALGLHWSP